MSRGAPPLDLDRLWNMVKYEVLSSPLGVLCTPVVVTLDMLTQQIRICRETFERRERQGDVPSAQLEAWRARLEQMEWEHVRRLERNGRGDDPFVLWKKGEAPSA